MNLHTDFVTASIDAPAEDSAVKELNERGFGVLVGLSEKQWPQILKLANQPHIKKYCPNDCTDKRFASLESTRKWLASGRAVFMLTRTEDKNNVIGYGWVGTKATAEVPGGETTFAVRLGEQALGQKLSEPFSRAIIDVSNKMFGLKNFWLETWASNGGAVHAYQKLGFELVSQREDKRAEGNDVIDDTRLFMTLSNENLQKI